MKKNVCFYIVLILAFTGIFLSSCDNDEPVEGNIVEINEDITTSTVWTGDKIYVINKYDFVVESELRIEAGAIIKFQPNYKSLTINEGGKILAIGTSSSPVIFTSYRDDVNGGDTNGDGGTTSPAVGDWASIDINGTTGSEFLYCKFLYGGYGIKASPTLDLSAGGSSARIENCTFANNGGGKDGNFYIGALHADNAATSTVIKNNSFYNNILPLSINAEIDIDNSNSFEYQGISNTFNAIFVSRNIEKNTTWQETEVAFVITTEDMQVGSGKVLTLGNNVVLKFVENSTLSLLSGESSLQNHDGQGVYFTSFKDDELKGDSNGDGNATAPAVADWVGIFLDNWTKYTGYAQWDNIRYNDPNAIVK